jgi:hypothetical protein
VNAGRAVVEAVRQTSTRPRVVIQASGIGAYGFCGDERVTENAPLGQDFLAKLSHSEWEPSTAAVEEMGVRRVIIRSGVVLSVHEGALVRLLLPYRLFVGGPMGSGKQWFSWIHPADQAAAIQFLIEDERASGPFNLTSPHPLTNAEFGRALGRVLGRPSLIPVPGFAMRMAFGEVSEMLLQGQRGIPQRLLDMGFTFHFPDAEGALRDLLR